MTSTIVKKSINQDVQRQPRVRVTAAPRMGPKAGPMNGVATYSDMGPDRFSGGQISLKVPDPMLRLGAAKKPAQNLSTTRLAILCAKPVPRMKSAKMGRLMKMRGRRPNVSLRGAANGPPKASPRAYMEYAKVAMSWVEWSSDADCSMAGVKTDDAKVPTNAMPDMVYV